MKVVQMINSLSNRGGAEVFFVSLCNELLKNKEIDLYVISLYEKTDNSFKNAIKISADRFISLNKKNSFDIKSGRRLSRVINKIKPDVINFHLQCYLTYFFAFGFKRRHWKIVKTFHSIPMLDQSKINNMFEKKFVKKNNISFVGISDVVSKKAKTLYPNISIKTIYNGINLPKTINVDSDKTYDFIIVASLTSVKNHKFLFEAFKEYCVTNSSAKLLCVGDGPLKEQCANYIVENKLGNNIFLAGQQDDVYPFLRQSKCFVLASTREGNPISIIEAMSQGLPIIAPAVGGIPDVVKPNCNGFLFQPENKTEVIKCFNMTSDAKLLAKITNNNILDAKKFSIIECAKQYVCFYKEILDE